MNRFLSMAMLAIPVLASVSGATTENPKPPGTAEVQTAVFAVG